MKNTPDSAVLPLLRQELLLHEAPPAENGSPRWTLEDPVRGLFFQLGWLETELLAHWDVSPQVVLSGVGQTTVLKPTTKQLSQFVQFLKNHQLVQSDEAQLTQLYQDKQARQQWWLWLFQRHLSFRISLCRPDPWLTKTYPLVRQFMTSGFLLLSLFVACIGLWLASHQWQQFTHGFSYLFSFQGICISVTTIICVKFIHELGHAFTCKKFGGRVASMGINFILFWPVLYTDVTTAWRMKQKRERILIGSAGIIAEAVIAAWALLLWNFVDEGIARSVLFTLATTSLFLSLSVNLSPLMRFDGYFIFSDWMDMPNLQQRANNIARWKIRSLLWGWKDPVPEPMNKRRLRIVILYALAMWVYRFALYLSISLAVYHLVFKALGIVLFLAEVAFLLVWPCVREIHMWIKNYQKMTLNTHSILTIFLCILLISGLIIPWHDTVKAPAVWVAQQQQLFVAQDARLLSVMVKNGQRVKSGQTLFRLSSPELNTAIKQLTYRQSSLRKQLQSYPFDKKTSAEISVIRDELKVVNQRLAEQKKRESMLMIKAPFDGTIVDVTPFLDAGDWLTTGQQVGTLIGEHRGWVDAYISEQHLGQINVGSEALFIAENVHQKPVPLILDKLAQGVVSDFRAHPELTSPYHGPIAAEISRKTKHPEPQQALYLAKLRSKHQQKPDFQMRGEVVIEGQGQSIIGRVWQSLMKVLIRESVM